MKAILLLFFASVLSFAQFGPEYVQSDSNSETTFTSRFFRDGSNNTQYVCKALSTQPIYNWFWAASTGNGVVSSIAVASNVATITFSAAHGLHGKNKIILGAATTTSLAGSYKVTISSATVVTITTSGVSDGNITSGTDPLLVISTNAPRGTAGVWSIYQLFYTTTYVDDIEWADGTSAYINICDNRATYAFN